ncbi:MAG TPA: hypothetical protein VJO34_11140 [Methylomirabilota bacterium]|nr:hypothetical protein [Methylomirabilota bacterium]
MNDYRSHLKVVGIALIVVGALDIGWTIYYIAHRMGYSSSFNVFAVIAGVLLIRGGLRTANVVAFFSAFMLSGFIGLFTVLPFLMSLDLIAAYLRLYPVPFGGSLLLAICVLILLGWVYRRLTSPPVLAAIAERHPRYTSFWRRPRGGFLAGVLLVVILVVGLSFLMHGATAQQAVTKAKEKVGEGYKFHVSSWSTRSSRGRTHVEAVVIAYNQREIKEIQVEWEE